MTEDRRIEEKGPLVVIPYVARMSEDISCVCRKFNIRVVFKSRWTLRSVLTNFKDTLSLGEWSNVVYRIPWSCIGETRRRLEMRLKKRVPARSWWWRTQLEIYMSLNGITTIRSTIKPDHLSPSTKVREGRSSLLVCMRCWPIRSYCSILRQ